MNHIVLDTQDESVKRFFLTLPANAQGAVVELNGLALACVVPVVAAGDGEWTEAKNERRCVLIEKEIDGDLTTAEAIELHALQQAMLNYRNKVAPLPIAAIRKLHDELLAKAGRTTTDE